jgi:putative membrane protein
MEQPQTHFFVQWLVSGLAVFLTAKMMPGFQLRGFITALFAALLIGFFNAILWPVLFFLTLPINILTLGLFTFVLNGALLKLCAGLLPGFDITSWWSAIFGSILLSIISMILHAIFF